MTQTSSDLVQMIEQEHTLNPKIKMPEFGPGDTVAVHARIKEGQKSRIQVFQGTVIATKSRMKPQGHFRVRKISSGIGVERIFPYHGPNIEKVELISRGKSRRSKLYYLRDRTGKAARVAMDYDKKKSEK